jgi:putative membrane protein
MVVLLGAATAFAQAGSTSTTGSSGADTSRRTQSGSTGSYDTGTSGTTSTSGARSGTSSDTRRGTSGTTDTSRDTYGTGTTSSTAMASDKLSWGDRRFVTKAADNGQAEVQVAELAAQRATNPEVKSFAQKLVEDHTKVNTELMSLASQKNVKVDLDDDKDRAYNRLNKKSGSEFDQEFVEHMIDQHEDDVKMFEKAASDAKDPQLRAFASKHVSHLREHLQEAQSLRQSVMPTGRTDDTSGRSTSGATTGSGLGTSSTGSTSTRGDATDPRRDSTATDPSSGTSPSDPSTTPRSER